MKNDYSSNVAIEIAETKFGTEEKSLLGGREIAESLFQNVKDKLLEKNWRLFCALVLHIAIGVVIGGIIVELFVHKAPSRTQQSTPSILTTTTAPITTQPAALSTKGGINVVINL